MFAQKCKRRSSAQEGFFSIRFTFSKFKTLSGMNSLHGYVMDTTAENLSTRVISSASFAVYLFDKAKVRVGEDVISLSKAGPSETITGAVRKFRKRSPSGAKAQAILAALRHD